jgi:hypothetical protein
MAQNIAIRIIERQCAGSVAAVHGLAVRRQGFGGRYCRRRVGGPRPI